MNDWKTEMKSESGYAAKVAAEIHAALIAVGQKHNALPKAITKGEYEKAPKWFRNLVGWVQSNSDWDELTERLLEEIKENTIFSEGYAAWKPDLGWLFTEKDGELGVDKVLSGKYAFRRKENIEAAKKESAKANHDPKPAQLTSPEELVKMFPGFTMFDGKKVIGKKVQ